MQCKEALRVEMRYHPAAEGFLSSCVRGSRLSVLNFGKPLQCIPCGNALEMFFKIGFC